MGKEGREGVVLRTVNSEFYLRLVDFAGVGDS